MPPTRLQLHYFVLVARFTINYFWPFWRVGRLECVSTLPGVVVPRLVTQTLSSPELSWIALRHARHVATIKASARKRHVHCFIKLKLLFQNLKVSLANIARQHLPADRLIKRRYVVGHITPLSRRGIVPPGSGILPSKPLFHCFFFYQWPLIIGNCFVVPKCRE